MYKDHGLMETGLQLSGFLFLLSYNMYKQNLLQF